MSVFQTVRRLALGGSPRRLVTLEVRRTIAGRASTYDFLVVTPDKPDARTRRLGARSRHFEELKSGIEAGKYKMGGALLRSVPKDDQVSSLDFVGSTLVVSATSEEEVLEGLKKDAYNQHDVWDFGKIQIYPFKPGFKMQG
ncbi:unnamed protein product [Clonostachys chloroleuca]|uniref:YCII-related domain-containing protein n=1 Tax=Clonostachys chloroleuca TaxID=1926264 RepID=A0AA35Q652_9HYPO|nr:unnamed protein product [Clonostachys chloroleuca]